MINNSIVSLYSSHLLTVGSSSQLILINFIMIGMAPISKERKFIIQNRKIKERIVYFSRDVYMVSALKTIRIHRKWKLIERIRLYLNLNWNTHMNKYFRIQLRRWAIQ